jgi:hypothetical protein
MNIISNVNWKIMIMFHFVLNSLLAFNIIKYDKPQHACINPWNDRTENEYGRKITHSDAYHAY